MIYKIYNFGELPIEGQYEVLNYFVKKDDRILFHSYATKIEEITEDEIECLKEEYFEQYCDDIIGFEGGVACKLEQNISKILQKYELNYDGDIRTYLSKFKYEQLDNKKREVFDKVKYEIFESVFLNEPPFRKSFVKERVIYTNYAFLEEDGLHMIDTSNIWYLLKNRQEVLYTMKMEVDYTCVIVDKKQEFLEYTYGLLYVESADNYDLVIQVKNNEDFIDRVLSKIYNFIIDNNKIQIKISD